MSVCHFCPRIIEYRTLKWLGVYLSFSRQVKLYPYLHRLFSKVFQSCNFHNFFTGCALMCCYPCSWEVHRATHVGKDLMQSKFDVKRECRWACLASCPVACWKPTVKGILLCPWGGCSGDWLFSEFLSWYIKLKPVPFAPCLLLLAPCEERTSVFFVATF